MLLRTLAKYVRVTPRAAIDMTRIDRCKHFFPNNRKKNVCQLLSQIINCRVNTFLPSIYSICLTFLASTNKNFEKKQVFNQKKNVEKTFIVLELCKC